MFLLESADDIPHRAGDEKVFLHQTQLSTGDKCVRGIEHLRNGFGSNLLLDSLEVVAVIEYPHVKVARGTSCVEAQAIHGPATVAGDQHVMRNPDQDLPIHPHGVVAALAIDAVLDTAIDGHQAGFLGAGDLPGRTLRQPVFRLLFLISIVYFLLEQTVLIVDAIATRWNPERGERIQEARSETAQPAIAQRGVFFTLFHGFQIGTEIVQRLAV